MTHKRKRGLQVASAEIETPEPKRTCYGSKQSPHQPLSLLDLSAQCVASNIPFQQVEQLTSRIPEPVQLRVAYWSFPRDERDICMYSSLNAAVVQNDAKRLPFQRGVSLLESNSVRDVLQVGFHLSGTVVEEEESRYGSQTDEYSVSIGFDRCKITSVACSCGNKDILWCAHVVALSLFRIRNPEDVTLRVPISETLLQMNRDQLQKLVQYLITEHHAVVLPTAQRLADEIMCKSSVINLLPGAPDPTAGASTNEENCWHLDAEQVREQVRNYLSQGGSHSSGKHLLSMFAKVREMLRVHDNNGSRMLRLITEQFLADPRLQLWKSQGTSMNDKCRQLWDQLGALWVCVVLNPASSQSEKAAWKVQLEDWGRQEVCPSENPDLRRKESQPSRVPDVAPRRTIFSRAISACDLSWEDVKLKHIISGGDNEGEETFLTWAEDVPVAAARVDALRAHGYPQEAIRLAVAITRGMKEEQLDKLHKMETLLERLTEAEVQLQLSEQFQDDQETEGWIGHPLDPVLTLYDTLIEESVEDFDCDADTSNNNDDDSRTFRSPLHDYRTFSHIPVPGRKDKSETYLGLAVEVALMGLGQQRTMPAGYYAQNRACRQEEHLIAQLDLLTFCNSLYPVLKRQIEILLGSGPFSGLGLCVHPKSIPMHTFARFLFKVFLGKDADLAFRLGLRALRFPLLDTSLEQSHRWYTLGHLESQQCELASCMFAAAKGVKTRVDAVLSSSLRHVHSASQLFRLAQDALKLSSGGEQDNSDCLVAAMELGLQVCKMTLATQNWRRREMVQWCVECAVRVGPSALSHVMTNWTTMFTPTEATTLVAATVMAPATASKLDLTDIEREALARCARALTLQCASRDPQNCSLSALTLCEKNPLAFEAAYRLVVESAASIPPTQLFAVARYMEHRSFPGRAFKLATLAMKHFSLEFNQDLHPSIGDVHWACGLAQSLGYAELSQMLGLVTGAVRCPTVLSDLLYHFKFSRDAAGKVDGRHSYPSYAKTADHIHYMLKCEEPLRQLLEATINAYVNTVDNRLSHIRPKHYSDFIEFLATAQETFHMAHDGARRFKALVNNINVLYRGKKKLMQLVKERFPY